MVPAPLARRWGRVQQEASPVNRSNLPSTKRPGAALLEQTRSRPFASEADLVETFVRTLRWGCPRGWSLLREIDAGVGIADLVLVPRPVCARADLTLLRRVPPRLAPLLSPSTARRVRSVQTFMQSTGMSQVSATRVLRDMGQARLASREGDTIQLHSVTAAPFKHVVVIEAKLYDWGRALTQAYRNRQFATQSWVVLDAHYPVSQVATEAFRQAQVGLVTCSTNGELIFHATGKTMPAESAQRFWVAQATISRSPRQVLRPLR